MNSTLLAALLAIATAVAAAVSTYLVAWRRTSGRIDTSDAKTLWEESQQMRSELRAEVITLRAEAVTLRSEVARLNTVIAQLRDEVHSLHVRLEQVGQSDGA